MGRHRRRGAGAASGRGRLTDISCAIEKAVRTAGRYGIVRGYGGHGIGTEMHQDPHVLNHGKPGRAHAWCRSCAWRSSRCHLGSPRTVELADGWTVVTPDGSMAAHVEHTMALLDDGVWVPDGRRRPRPAGRPGHRPPTGDCLPAGVNSHGP